MAEVLPPISVEPLPLPASSLRVLYAQKLLEDYLRLQLSPDDTPLDKLADEVETEIPPPTAVHPGQSSYKGRICIVGAGAAGLYLGMMLKYLGINNVDILEASNRVGGRCYTHRFLNDEKCPHNYYDVGAMRIPDIDTMKSTLKLIEILHLEEKKQKYTYEVQGSKPPSIRCYNHNDTSLDASNEKYTTAIHDLAEAFGKDFEKAFEENLKHNDLFSTRGWLMTQPEPACRRLTYPQTVDAESYNTSTGLFDQAFTETLCDYTDFQAAAKKDWFRIEGGMSVLTDAMEESLLTNFWPHEKPDCPKLHVKRETSVVAMSEEGNKIHVTSTDKTGKATTTEYDMVFSTTAMAPLQRMDLSGLKLESSVLTGIRTLSYDRATKVAIKFKTPWWDSFYNKPTDFGGISSTDLPISNVVYPSWRDGQENHAVLMVSYSWAQDATRMGAMVPDYSRTNPSRDEPLVTLCLRNLATLWSEQPNAPTFEFLYDQYQTHHAWAWSHDPYTGGAFALFGPGQFSNTYPDFQKSFCNNKLAFCGEALSINHAWISGALDSAYAALLRWLCGGKRCDDSGALKASPFGGGKNKHPCEVREDLIMGAVKLTKEIANKTQ